MPTESSNLEPVRDEGGVARMLRRFMLAILVFAMIGTFVELVLLHHYEDRWQVIPLALLGMATIALVWHSLRGSTASVWAIRVLMLFFFAASIAGLVLHYRASADFHRDLDPTIKGWALVMEVFKSKAPPALAPALFLQMGLIGMAYTYRHPALMRS